MSSGSERRQRKKSMRVRLTDEELALIEEAAAKVGLSLSSYARHTLLGAPAPREVRRHPIDNKELVRLLAELGKIGSNLNQLAKSANQGIVVYQQEILVVLGGLNVLRDAILVALGRTP